MRISSSFGLLVKANLIRKFHSIEQLKSLWKLSKKKKYPFLVLGKINKTIFIENFSGIVALNCIQKLRIRESKNNNLIYVGSGNSWKDLVETLLKMRIYGLENMSFIPGSVGAASVQNMGAYGLEFKDVCKYVDTIDLSDGKKKRFYNQECKFKYRGSIFKKIKYKNFIVISVCLKIRKSWQPVLNHKKIIDKFPSRVTVKDITKFIFQERCKSIPNPSILGNSGSFFKNPTVHPEISDWIKKKFPKYQSKIFFAENKIHAGWLIKQCNLQGYRIGGAEVYRKNPLILINRGYSTGQDIIKLSQYVHQKVFEKFGISLEKEAIFIGKNGEIT
ncbi:UDP-N-acetylmuramate dehydrogenase [Candidatus Riesia pediculicola]|uniref:UDP-N-acetylmuramate dehydrogenase n=1 Tax=Candidatus Riesia pediculicola TaxID=401619 RepID=UPI0009C39D73|nr:UDP-N-acetylmuramate dehydrogenase [Candidatus Riesia pediculicola]ARC54325.1 hypothetical protein AOE57_01865 [Candidatus Riesia pediculicola]